MSAGDARKALITRAARLRYDNKITQEQYEAIKATPFGSGGTWGSTNSFAFEDAEIAARTTNVQEQTLRDNEQQQAHDSEAKEWLTQFQTGYYSQAPVQQILEFHPHWTYARLSSALGVSQLLQLFQALNQEFR